MIDWRETLVSMDASIREALSVIDRSALQIALVVDEERRLLGVVTDGDVRRGILRDTELEAPVTEVMNDAPTTVATGRGRDEVLALMRRERLHQVPVVDADGRVVGLEVVDDLLEPDERDNLVVLLAGGLGTRLRPLTEDRPKPLVEVGDRPILETTLETLIDQGFRRFFLSVNYKAAMIEEHFGDGSDRGVEIRYLREDKRLGTAGPLHLLPERPSEPMIVMNGDLLTKLDFAQLVEFHVDQGAIATMGVREYEVQVPYGVVETEEQRIVDIEEKPTRRFFVNGGVYVLDPEAVDFVPEGEHFDMPDLFRRLRSGGHETVVFPIREYWLDVGRLEDLEKASEQFDQVFR